LYLAQVLKYCMHKFRIHCKRQTCGFLIRLTEQHAKGVCRCCLRFVVTIAVFFKYVKEYTVLGVFSFPLPKNSAPRMYTTILL